MEHPTHSKIGSTVIIDSTMGCDGAYFGVSGHFLFEVANGNRASMPCQSHIG